VVHGDGTSIWTLTHHRDFAKGLIGLLKNTVALDNIYHITSDEWLPWNQIYQLFGQAFGVEPKLVHVPSEVIGRYDDFLHSSLLGDKAHSMIFDNSKIKKAVPEFDCTIKFAEGVKEIAGWYKSNPEYGKIDSKMDAVFDKLVEIYG